MAGFYKLHDTLINFFYDYLPVPCSLILEADPKFWHAISIPQRGLHASYFELYFGRRQARWNYNATQLKRAAATRKAVLGNHAGMQDLFIPIPGPRGKGLLGWVVLGSFQARVPGNDSLWQQWKSLRRSPYAAEMEEYLMYCHARLEVPALDAGLRAGLSSVLAEAGAALLGQGSAEAASASLNQFKVERLSRRLPWRMWHYVETRRDRFNFNQGPVEGAEVAPWDAAEFGLKRAPDTAIALCIRDAAADDARTLALTSALQMEVFEFCRTRPGMVAGRSGMQAALLVASAANRLQARDLASQLHASLSRKLGLPLLASWCSQPRKPLGIWQAIASAEEGLRLAAVKGVDISEALAGASAPVSQDELEGISLELAQHWAEGRADAARLTQQKLCEAALQISTGRIDLLRAHLHWCLAPLLQRLEKRGMTMAAPAGALRGELNSALARAVTPRELLQRFAALSEDLGSRLSRPAEGEKRQMLRQSLRAISEHPESPESLAGFASQIGLSPSRLSRLLKSGSGSGFSKARSQARLEKAKRLLSESGIAVAAVAQECGWSSHAHFSRLFRRMEGMSPLTYRKKNQIVR